MANSPAPPARPGILIADDSADSRRLLALLLQPEGYRLLIARDGDEALRIAEQAPDLALIVLDVLMPGLSGLDVCRRLRARQGDRYVPIILATGLADQEHVAQGLEAGADDYLTKPFVQGEVIARVRSALRLKRATDGLLEARELAAVGAMAVTLAHEINNPLTAILGNVDLLLHRPDLDPSVRAKLEKAHEASERVRELVQRLGAIKRVVTTSYVASLRMLDLDNSCPEAEGPPVLVPAQSPPAREP